MNLELKIKSTNAWLSESLFPQLLYLRLQHSYSKDKIHWGSFNVGQIDVQICNHVIRHFLGRRWVEERRNFHRYTFPCVKQILYNLCFTEDYQIYYITSLFLFVLLYLEEGNLSIGAACLKTSKPCHAVQNKIFHIMIEEEELDKNNLLPRWHVKVQMTSHTNWLAYSVFQFIFRCFFFTVPHLICDVSIILALTSLQPL